MRIELDGNRPGAAGRDGTAATVRARRTGGAGDRARRRCYNWGGAGAAATAAA